MAVSVLFCGMQRMVADTDKIQIPLGRETRVNDVLVYVQERYPTMPLNEGDILLTVNNRVVSRDHVLESEDKICFLPHIGGG